MALPPLVFDLKRAPPGRMSAPRIVGASIEAGISQSGLSSAVDISGGGFVAIKYSNVQLSNAGATQLKYWSQLRGQLVGGVRQITVPFLIDFMQPRPAIGYDYADFACTDGLTTTDGFGTTDMRPLTTCAGALALNAGQVTFSYPTSVAITGGEWFDLLHATKGYRSYEITDVISSSVVGSNTSYVVAIRPTIREITASGAVMNFERPRCNMRLEPGTDMPFDIESAWVSRPEVSFIEAF